MKTSRGRFSRPLEVALLFIGMAGVAAWLVSIEIALLAQSWDNFAFERESRGEATTVSGFIKEQQRQLTDTVRGWVGLPVPAAPATTGPLAGRSSTPIIPPIPRTPANNELLGRLAIPRLHLLTTVREGTGDVTLALSTGHIRGTTFPGQNGNVGVAGHRDTFFRGLSGIKVQDQIEFETMDAKYVYVVESTNIVKPDNVGVLSAGHYPELTLVTCYPFDYIGSAPERFIVKARQVSQSPLRTSFANLTPVSQQVGVTPVANVAAVASASPAKSSEAPATRARVSFQVAKKRSQQLAPGISFGVTALDTLARRVDGWVWIMPERQTIWVRDQKVQDPVIFYQDGEKRELMIANVTDTAASGYLLLRPSDAR